MPSLKSLRGRIKSVKNTQQITKTMKLVAAAKVRRARARSEAAQPYAEKMHDVLVNLAAAQSNSGPLLLSGRDEVKTLRLVVISSDRGLCGGFNAGIIKKTEDVIAAHSDKKIEILCLGRKAKDTLKIKHSNRIIDVIEGLEKNTAFDVVNEIAAKQIADFEAGLCDEIIMISNKFESMMSQVPTVQHLAPFKMAEVNVSAAKEYEPSEEEILATLLPRNVSIQLLRGLLDSAASEHAARMAAMENATKNAGEMISKLSLQYNRTRQAAITTELTEIVAGAEAV